MRSPAVPQHHRALRRGDPYGRPPHRTPCKVPCHCEASAYTGFAIRITPTPVPKHNKSIPGPPSEGPGIHFLQEVSHFTQIFFFSIQAAPVTDSTMAAAIMTMWLLSPVAGALTTRGMVSVLVAWHTWQV